MGPADEVDGRVGLRLRCAAGVGLDDDGIADERVLGDRRRELAAELAVGQVQRALVDQPERGGVPERRRAAVAEDDLVAVGHREQLPQPVAHPADEVLDRRLPVRRSEHVARGGQRRQLLGADLGGAASEAAVAGLEVGGDREVGHAVKSSDRSLRTFCGEGGQKMPEMWVNTRYIDMRCVHSVICRGLSPGGHVISRGKTSTLIPVCAAAVTAFGSMLAAAPAQADGAGGSASKTRQR